MTPEELKTALEECVNKESLMYDEEEIHKEMDKLLVRTLRSLGYDEAMNVFDNQTKWYS